MPAPSRRASISREPEAYGATRASSAWLGPGGGWGPIAIVSPARPRTGLAPSAERSSTTRQRSSSLGARVAKWTRTAVPLARVAATAAGSVADTLTTTRSPGRRNSGSS